MASKYRQRSPGEWCKMDENNLIAIACCDCSLVHVMEVKGTKGKYQICGYRDNRATGQLRRQKAGRELQK